MKTQYLSKKTANNFLMILSLIHPNMTLLRCLDVDTGLKYLGIDNLYPQEPTRSIRNL